MLHDFSGINSRVIRAELGILMTTKRFRLALIGCIVTGATSLSGCSGEFVDYAEGCRKPKNESALIEMSSRDSMITDVIPQAKNVRSIEKQRACIDPTDDGPPTLAGAWRSFLLPKGESRESATEYYKNLGLSLGWNPAAGSPSTNNGGIALCRVYENATPTFFELRFGQAYSIGQETVVAVFVDLKRQC